MAKMLGPSNNQHPAAGTATCWEYKIYVPRANGIQRVRDWHDFGVAGAHLELVEWRSTFAIDINICFVVLNCLSDASQIVMTSPRSGGIEPVDDKTSKSTYAFNL